MNHRSQNGVVYLIPDWNSPAFTDQGALHASLDRSKPALYYLFFRVSCYAGPGAYDGTTSEPQEFDVYPVGQQQHRREESFYGNGDAANLIFQHSFYVYISLSKYPF